MQGELEDFFKRRGSRKGRTSDNNSLNTLSAVQTSHKIFSLPFKNVAQKVIHQPIQLQPAKSARFYSKWLGRERRTFYWFWLSDDSEQLCNRGTTSWQPYKGSQSHTMFWVLLPEICRNLFSVLEPRDHHKEEKSMLEWLLWLSSRLTE